MAGDPSNATENGSLGIPHFDSARSDIRFGFASTQLKHHRYAQSKLSENKLGYRTILFKIFHMMCQFGRQQQ